MNKCEDDRYRVVKRKRINFLRTTVKLSTQKLPRHN